LASRQALNPAEEAAAGRAAREASLYVHIPFCRSKCAYCDFYSLPGLGPEAMEAYAESLEDELSAMAAWRRETLGWKSAYIGGGTPSILPRRSLRGLLRAIKDSAGGGTCRDFEWTMECNPESLDQGLLDCLGEGGLTRLSLGIQSLEEKALEAAQRPCGVGQARAAIELVARSWPGEKSADLILGLPAQSLRGLREGLEEVAEAGFQHISLYCLTVEEGTLFHTMRLSVPELFPSPEAEEEAWIMACELLKNLGFQRYEVSNFALPGHECRHNLGYWRMDPYIGLGAGAVSSLPLPGGKTLRRTAARDIEAYISRAWKSPDGGTWIGGAAEIEIVSKADSMKEFLLMGLRCARGISAAAFRDRFGLELEEAIGETIRDWAARGLAFYDGETLSLKPAGLDLLDTFLIKSFVQIDSIS
jgi:oxygen-independent coproporphyrinogen-3 oxidase